tara:strand:+ start:437 stop:1150 length:714 start_codon:yes stop_codon:yes gene_type:complete
MSVEKKEIILEVSGLNLHPDAPALDFSLKRGEALTFIGGNGTGKSRLLAALIGQADCGGFVAINGHDVNSPSERMHALAKVGILFQESGLLRDLDVESNISLPARVRGWPTGDDAVKEAELLLGLSGCDYARYSFASEISSGESKRIALARCLSGGSEVLLLDEPVAGLSSEHREAVLDLLSTLRTEGVISGLVIFTDDKIVASRLSDTFIPLRREGTVFGIPGRLTQLPRDPTPVP